MYSDERADGHNRNIRWFRLKFRNLKYLRTWSPASSGDRGFPDRPRYNNNNDHCGHTGPRCVHVPCPNSRILTACVNANGKRVRRRNFSGGGQEKKIKTTRVGKVSYISNAQYHYLYNGIITIPVHNSATHIRIPCGHKGLIFLRNPDFWSLNFLLRAICFSRPTAAECVTTFG